MSAPAAVRVSCWGESRGQKRIPGALQVLVGGQYAGSVYRDSSGWHARRQARALGQSTETSHADADEALAAVLRSGFARQLGARAASAVFWSDKARRAAKVAR